MTDESNDMKHDSKAAGTTAPAPCAKAAGLNRRQTLGWAAASLMGRPPVAAGAAGLTAGLVTGLFSPQAAHAQEMSNMLPDLIDKSRQAVVAVGTFSATDNPRFGFRGTGFVVGDGKTIVTCAHVIPNPQEKDLAILVPGSGSPTGQPQQRPVRLLRRDATRDLAVLALEDGAALPVTLTLASVDDSATVVREGVAVALMGYPLGTSLGVQLVTHRGIVAALTKAALPAPTSGNLSERAIRQLRAGDMEFLQLDITAYPGNSGGPLLDIRTGKVVGVVNMVALKSTRESALSAPSGISYAVPVKYVLPLLVP